MDHAPETQDPVPPGGGAASAGPDQAAGILAALRDGIMIRAVDGRILDANDAFLDLVGRPRDEVVGVGGPPYPWHADPADAVALFNRIQDAEGGLGEAMFRRPDGEVFPVQVSGAALRDRDGRITGFLASCRDVGPLRRAEEEARRLEQSEREAIALLAAEREARQMKDEFLAMVSHELRTPLTSVLGYQELAMADTTEPEVRALLEVANRNGRHLALMVDDFLLLGRANTGQLALQRRPVSLSELVRRSLEEVRAAAAAAEVTIEEEVAPGVVADADPDRVSQVLGNLISNALAFSPQAGRVRVGVRDDEAGATVTVADEGPVIPPHERARIFDPFHRVVQSAAGVVEGNGLRLAVSKALMEAHGGALTVTAAGRETVFSATWPRGGGLSPSGGGP